MVACGLPFDEGTVHASASVRRTPEHIEDVVVGDHQVVGVKQLDDGSVDRIANLLSSVAARVDLAELDLDPDVGDVDVAHAVLVELHLHAIFGSIVIHPEVGAVLCEDFRE